MKSLALVLALFGPALAGCGKRDPAQSVCEELCSELVSTCDYAAFPTSESCVQGCLYSSEQGADIEGELACVLDSACDTFAVVECEHQYGPL